MTHPPTGLFAHIYRLAWAAFPDECRAACKRVKLPPKDGKTEDWQRYQWARQAVLIELANSLPIKTKYEPDVLAAYSAIKQYVISLKLEYHRHYNTAQSCIKPDQA